MQMQKAKCKMQNEGTSDTTCLPFAFCLLHFALQLF